MAVFIKFNHLVRKLLIPFSARFPLPQEIRNGKIRVRESGLGEMALEIRTKIAASEFLSIEATPSIQLLPYLDSNDVKYFYRQRLMVILLCGEGILNALALAKYLEKELWYPLPKSWRQEFTKSGVSISYSMCTIMWYVFCAIFTVSSIFKAFKVMKNSRLHRGPVKLPLDIEQRTRIYLPDISILQLPHDQETSTERNFSNWLKKYQFADKKIHIYHNFPKFPSFVDSESDITISYLGTGSESASIYSSPTIFLRKVLSFAEIVIRNPLLFNTLFSNVFAIFEFLEFDLTCSDLFPEKVIFTNSSGILKPLWARGLEKSGVEVVICFYAIATNPVQESINQKSLGYWALSTWKNFWVTDAYQLNFFSSLVIQKDAQFMEVGIPHWSDSETKIITSNKCCISVFDDFIPVNYSDLTSLQFEELYELERIRDFLTSVVEIASKLDSIVLHKEKFRFRNRRSFAYRQLIEDLQSKFPDNYLSVDPKIAPSRLIEMSYATVSMPVSTTGVISLNSSIPSVYYGPHFNIVSGETGLRGIPMIHSKNQLESWLFSVHLEHIGRAK